MGYFSFGSEAVLAFRILLYWAACILGGAALIGFGIYVILLCSELLLGQPAQGKAARRKGTQSACTFKTVQPGLEATPARWQTLTGSQKQARPILWVSPQAVNPGPVTQERQSDDL